METLKEKLQRIQERVEGGMSSQFLKIMHSATRDLEASGIGQQVLRRGATAPRFELKNQQGEKLSSDHLLTQGPLVLTFYRGFWCPYCNADLAHLQLYLEQIQSMGATLLAVSPEMPVFSRKIMNTQKLNFDILFDEGNRLAEDFHLRFSLPNELKNLYRDTFNVNLKLYHGDDDWTLPIPGRFVIDQSGEIQYSESCIDYRQRPEVEDLLDVLKNMPRQ